MKKKSVKKIAIAFGFLFLVLSLALLFAHMDFVKQKILHSILSDLEKNQGIHISVESLDYNLLNLRFTLKQVMLHAQEKRHFSPVFQAEKIRANIPFSMILKWKLRVQDLEVINPKIHIQIDQDGKHNLPYQAGQKKTRQASTQLPKFIINRLVLKNADCKSGEALSQIFLSIGQAF